MTLFKLPIDILAQILSILFIFERARDVPFLVVRDLCRGSA